MLIFRGVENIPKDGGYSVAIGNFDGMHLGHQSVIEIAREKSNKSSVGVVTFEPHPRQYFQKKQPIFRLMKSKTRQRFLSSSGLMFFRTTIQFFICKLVSKRFQRLFY